MPTTELHDGQLVFMNTFALVKIRPWYDGIAKNIEPKKTDGRNNGVPDA